MKITNEHVAQDAAALRRDAFRTEVGEGEQLGALVKAVRALAAGKPIPADAVAVLDAVDAVKARIKPKEQKR